MRHQQTFRILALVIGIIFCFSETNAQRMRHGASRSSFNRMGNSSTINGGSYGSRNRSTQPSASQTPSNRQANVNRGNAGGNRGASAGTSDVNRSGQRNANAGTRDIDRNTVVRNNNVNVYHRPPYAYGRHHYHAHHPYYYHPYHAYYWGPAYNPWGAFVAVVTITAVVVIIENEQEKEAEKQKYYYDEGVWYTPGPGGYTVVSAPIGGTVGYVPEGTQIVIINNETNYYYGGSYYEKSGEQYKVVPPPAGAVVDNLPEGGEEVKIGDQTYVKIGQTFYQPVQIDGKPKYEVVQVEEVEK